MFRHCVRDSGDPGKRHTENCDLVVRPHLGPTAFVSSVGHTGPKHSTQGTGILEMRQGESKEQDQTKAQTCIGTSKAGGANEATATMANLPER